MLKIDEKNEHVIAFRAGKKKFHELQQTRAKKKHELNETTVRYVESQKTLDVEAGELLAIEGGEGFQPAARADIEKLQREVEVLGVAIEMQRKIIERLRNAYSRSVCQANHVRYVEIEKRISRAVAELAASNEEEERFFKELRGADVKPVGFRSTRVSTIGTFKDAQSGASFHRKEVQQFLPEAAV